MTDREWGGLFPVLVTPFDEHGAVDERSLRAGCASRSSAAPPASRRSG